jgi:hypothetical protein
MKYVIDGNDLIHSFNDTAAGKGYFRGLRKREYFAANNNSITWQDAAINCESTKGETPTISEVATYLAKMKVIYADALIKALNEQSNGSTHNP